LTAALGFYQRALPILQEIGNRYGEATALSDIGMVHADSGLRRARLGNFDQALTLWQTALGYFEQALTIRREIGDRAGEASTLNNIGLVHHNRGDWQPALSYFEKARSIFREVGSRNEEATTLNNIGMVLNDRRDWRAALSYLEQALPIHREVGDRTGEAVTRYNIAAAHKGEGRLLDAVAELELVVALDEAIQHPDLEADRAALKRVRAELDLRRSAGGSGA
jgi:tetratricopeptide (TPR) repeat protein